MPISALLLTAAGEPGDLLAELERYPALSELTSRGRRIGVVLDTPDEVANRAAWTWLRTHPSIAQVDVIQIFFDPPPGVDT